MAEEHEPLPTIDFTLLTQTITVKEGGQTLSLAEQLDNLYRQAVAEARYHGKEASITLELKFKPGSGNQLDIFPTAKSKLPIAKPNPIPLFANDEGQVFAEDPSQRPIPKTAQFRTVRGGDKSK
ncbi:MAG TPA: hypothetical protein VF761_17100 [Gemmatimonadaceae bacterium]